MLPKDAINEVDLNDNQKKIIKKELSELTKKNLHEKWIGYKTNYGWKFIRHGFEIIQINEEKGNIARQKLIKLLDEKFI